jgi:predicted permease
MASLLDGLLELYVCIGKGFGIGLVLERKGARGPVEKVLTWIVINAVTPIIVFTSLVKNAVNIPWENVATSAPLKTWPTHERDHDMNDLTQA